MRIPLLLVFFGLLFCGCNRLEEVLPEEGSPPGVLTTDEVLYQPGADVTLTLYNLFEEQIGYNLCTSQLERQVDAAWESVPEGRVCTLELRTLARGEEATYVLTLPEDLVSGTYRYAAEIFETEINASESTGGEGIASNPFRVEG